MDFYKQLNEYFSILKCSAKELSESSTLSPAVISRYRNNQKLPEKNSELLKKLANGIVKIALEKNILDITYKDVYFNLNSSLKKPENINFEQLSNNFSKLISICNINMAEMARALSVDPSNLSRIRTGQRKPSHPDSFIVSVCSYIVRHYDSNSAKKTISYLINCDVKELNNQSDYLAKLKTWLCSQVTESHNYIDEFLRKLDDFDLDDYIRTIHFDELKVPSVPFQFPNSKNYYGIEEMKKGEIDFFKSTVLSKSKDSVFMCSDMPMEDMAKDIDFGKKWMFAIAMTLKKGLHLDIIHNLDRPFNEMMIGLESWIPIYMTGQISPYYFKGFQNNLYCNLTYVSGNVALSGECINGYHNNGKYYFTNNKDEVAYYREKSDLLLKKASSLMEIYLKNSNNIYNAFMNSSSRIEGSRRRILSSLPLFAISKELLLEILNHNSVSDIDIDNILKFIEQEKDIIKNITTENPLLDEIPELSRENFEKHPVSLALSGMFYEKKILYTYEEYLKHLELIKEYTKVNKNYSIQTNTNTAFRNIQIFIHEGKWVMISKESSPTIHFVIHHPKLCNAIENFVVPIIE